MKPEDFEKLDSQLILAESFIENHLNRKIVPSIEVTEKEKTFSFDNITPNMDLSQFSQEKLYLLHSMLHLFYSNKSGKGLNEESIVKIHNKVKESLSSHQFFDKLDMREEL